MIIETDTIISNVCSDTITVAKDCILTVTGICSQKVLVEANSKIIVHGICNNLEISKNSYADIYGTVNRLTNHGNVSIYGIVNKLEDLSENTFIKAGAYVNSKEY